MGTESECMLQLAAEAFQSKNYDLAADIYEHQLSELADPGCRLDLTVKRADALALGGKLAEAFGVYRQASEAEGLRPAHLDTLLVCLVEHIGRRPPGGGDAPRNRHPAGGDATGGCGAFSCGLCLGFLFEPATLPCGHCFCKRCLDREGAEKPVRCRDCGDGSRLTDVRSYRVNVALSGLLCKWFPAQTHAVRLRREGNGLYAEKRSEEALEKYNQAILMAPSDHILFSNRSQIHSTLKHYEMALRDAESACRLKPHWSKGHVRKAQALASIGRTEEALREYLLCLSMQPDCRLARSEAQKLLSDFLAPLTEQVPDRILDYSSLLSSRAHLKSSIAQLDAPTVPPPLKTSQPPGHAQSPSESALLPSTLPPDAPGRRLHPCEAVKASGIRGQEEAAGRKRDRQLLLLKRKRRSAEEAELDREEEEEEEEGKAGGDCKRAKHGSAELPGPWSSVVDDLVDPTDLECSLCMRIFYEPVATPCGHTFCLKCLERCLDHNPKCPLCKEELSEFLARRQYCKTVLMENLISKYLPTELLERQNVNQEEIAELSNLNKNVPIFVCTMAFPTVPCPLHIFEPCYRLMIRRCMETGTKCFGMCLGDDLKGFADYGCLLEIRNVEFFSDGRSVVDTIGRRRFKVVQHNQRDGYNTADIEYLEDVKVEGVAEQELQSLHNVVYDQALVWLNSLKVEQKERILGHFGPMPEKDSEPQASPNGPSWCWWLLAVLPLEGRAQLPFLALTSLKERLSGIRRVLLFMTRSRHR